MNKLNIRYIFSGWHISRGALNATLALLAFCLVPNLQAIGHQPGDRGGDQPPTQVAAADTLEPNDTPAAAVLLVWDSSGRETRSGPANITSGLDLDFFAIELDSGDSLSAVAAAGEAGANTLRPAVSILDSTGIVIASDLLSPGKASATVSADGRYLVLVSDRSLLEGSPFTGAARGYELLLTRHLRRGDVDGSGTLDYRDAFIVFMLAAGLLDPALVDPREVTAADLDGDGAVDMGDFRLLVSRVEFIPVRDPLAGGKQKESGTVTRLALADGSVVELNGQVSVQVLASGALADSTVSLWAGLTGGAQLPTAARPTLAQNSPNPFNPSTTISFNLPEQSRVDLEVFSATGRRVATLAAGEYPAGTHRINWNGTDNRGRPVASGVYFYRLTAGSATLTRKLVVLK